MFFTANDAQNLQQIMQWRRDVRHFRPDPVAPALIDKHVAAMDVAPSVGNCRPRRVIRVQDPGRRRRIAELFAHSNAAAAASYPDADRDAYLGLKLAGLHEAPDHLAVFSVPDPAQGRGLGRQTMPETVVYSTVMAMYALWLVARAENLGVGWVSILDPRRRPHLIRHPIGNSSGICALVTLNLPMIRHCCTTAAGRPIRRIHGWSGDAGNAAVARIGSQCQDVDFKQNPNRQFTPMTQALHRFNALIFDLDGTLIDSAPDMADAVNLYLAAQGWPVQDTAYVARFIGHGPRRLLLDMFTDLQLPTDEQSIDAAHAAFMAQYWAHPTRLTEFYPDVKADLHSLHGAGIALGLCTNKPQALTQRILDQLAIAPLFSAVLGADAVPACKPDPGHLLAVATKMGLQPGTWAYVGDSGIDQATARSADVPFFVVPWGSGPQLKVAERYRLTRLRNLI